MNCIEYLKVLLSDLFGYVKTQNPTVVPTGTPTPPTDGKPQQPPLVGTKTTLADIIRAYNAPFTSFYPVGSTTVKAQIHQIDSATADKVASLIERAAAAHPDTLDPIYLAACIMQESRFDPACFNHNTSATRPTASFEHTDWGMCQMAGSFLSSKDGMAGLTSEQMAAKAQDADWAVPTMGNLMASNIKTALNSLASDADLAHATKTLNTTHLTDAQFLATLFYNRGVTGGIGYIKANDTAHIKHPYSVAKWHDKFLSDLKSDNTSFAKYYKELKAEERP